MANVPSFRVWYRGASACTLVPVFDTEEHPNVPSFRFWVPGNIRQNHPLETTLLRTPELFDMFRAGQKPLTLQSLLFFFRFPCFFCCFPICLAFLWVFPFLSKDFRGSAERKTLAFFGVSLAFSKQSRRARDILERKSVKERKRAQKGANPSPQKSANPSPQKSANACPQKGAKERKNCKQPVV